MTETKDPKVKPKLPTPEEKKLNEAKRLELVKAMESLKKKWGSK